MTSLPVVPSHEGIIVISCSAVTPENIIFQIIGAESESSPVSCCDNMKRFHWSLTTKYYSAEVNLYALQKETELSPSFCDTIKAIILCFDYQKESSFEEVLKWLPYLKGIEAEVKLLLCNNSPEDADAEKKRALNWCIENEFELIELDAPHESDDEDEAAFKEAKGYGRVIEALQAHMWADLVMKDERTESNRTPEKVDSKVDEVNAGCSQPASSTCNGSKAENAAQKSANTPKVQLDEQERLRLEEQIFSNVLNGEDPGGESFESLFSRFASMKEKASGLTGRERKKYAQEVTAAFWQAMGLPDGEFDDLQDDTDEHDSDDYDLYDYDESDNIEDDIENPENDTEK